MMIQGLLFLAAVIPAANPTLTVIDADRVVRGVAYGYDWEYNDGYEVVFTNDAASGEWIETAAADLSDWWGYPVGYGACYQESQIDPSSLYFTLDTTAETYGNHYWADATGRGDYHVTFSVAKKVRYAVRAHADVTYGYNESSVRLAGSAGTVFSCAAYQGDNVSLEKFGWIAAGTYTLDGVSEVFAYGGYGWLDEQAGNAECEFRIFDAADYDMDGDVDGADKSKFKADYLAGKPGADFDFDGDTDVTDWNLYRSAWNQATA
jgi:hypothetical protein